jgi:hypothetical protein
MFDGIILKKKNQEVIRLVSHFTHHFSSTVCHPSATTWSKHRRQKRNLTKTLSERSVAILGEATRGSETVKEMACIRR